MGGREFGEYKVDELVNSSRNPETNDHDYDADPQLDFPRRVIQADLFPPFLNGKYD